MPSSRSTSRGISTEYLILIEKLRNKEDCELKAKIDAFIQETNERKAEGMKTFICCFCKKHLSYRHLFSAHLKGNLCSFLGNMPDELRHAINDYTESSRQMFKISKKTSNKKLAVEEEQLASYKKIVATAMRQNRRFILFTDMNGNFTWEATAGMYNFSFGKSMIQRTARAEKKGKIIVFKKLNDPLSEADLKKIRGN